jgi:hypothetical protein
LSHQGGGREEEEEKEEGEDKNPPGVSGPDEEMAKTEKALRRPVDAEGQV